MPDRPPDLLASALAMDALLRAAEDAPRPVVGDEARQAVSALRGYSYQLYASALAWLDLPPDAELHLEVAEDYAVALGKRLDATQVKDVTGTVSLAAEPARAAIAAFVKLAESNPGLHVRLTFLSTATVTTERRSAHRPGGVPGIQRWSEAAEGGEIAGLRRVLLDLDLGEDAHRYIRERDDERLRRELLQRVEWRCGEADHEELDRRLRERLAELCLDDLEMPRTEGARLAPHVLQTVLRTCTRTGTRKLTHGHLRGLLRDATMLGMDRRTHNLFSAATAEFLAAAVKDPRPGRSWTAEAEIPLPPLLVRRDTLAARLADKLPLGGTALLHGGTGMGKTALARLAARRSGGAWNLLELRHTGAEEAGNRLLAYARRPSDGIAGVIADDVPDMHLADLNPDLVRAMRMLADRGELVLATSARPLTARGAALLGMPGTAVVAVPSLTAEELELLVQEAGGDTSWAAPLQIASRGGHPQLASALVTGLRQRGWPEHERSALTLMNAAELEEEDEATRARLVRAVPDPGPRRLLHRVSVVADRFPREVAVALGSVEPALPLPGDLFDSLLGPWIDRVSADRYRISPLLEGAGRRVLGRDEIAAVHREIAECLTTGREILADQVDNVFAHALEACASRPLHVIAALVVSSSDREARRLRPHALRLLAAAADRPIVGWSPELSAALRLAQMLLASAREFDGPAADAARALVRELGALKGKHATRLEAASLSKLLFRSGMSRLLPEWPALLARFLNIAADLPGFDDRHPATADGQRLGPVLFASGILDLDTVAQLADAFDRLSALAASVRDEILGPNVDVTAIVQAISPWLKEREGGSGNVAAALGHYRRMADLATSWGHREWAIALEVAGAELRQQELKDYEGARAALEAAAAALGEDRWLRRAKQKILFARRDDRAVVSLTEILHGAFGEDALEAAHLLREGAISASRLGEHDRAAAWFEAADALASQNDLPSLQAMAVGLGADAAAEIWRSGDRRGALSAMAAVLDRLPRVDPQADLQSGYVHRIVRHSLLWFAHSAGMHAVEINGSAPALPPGACSNPLPPEEILGLPLLSLDIGWYFLFQIAMAAGCPEAAPDPATRIVDGPITDMEIAMSRLRLDRAIAEADAVAFTALLPGAIDAWAAARASLARQTLGQPHDWRRGEVPTAGRSDPASTGYMADAVLAFRAATGATGRGAAAERLRLLLASSPEPVGAGLLETLFPSGPPLPIGRRSPETCAGLLGRQDLSPAELLECCLRLAMQFENSDLRRSVERPLVRWAKAEWLRMATARRFSLSTPSSSAPLIQAAAALPAEDLQTLALLLEAALQGAAMRLPPGVREWLGSMARTGTGGAERA